MQDPLQVFDLALVEMEQLERVFHVEVHGEDLEDCVLDARAREETPAVEGVFDAVEVDGTFGAVVSASFDGAPVDYGWLLLFLLLSWRG